MTTHRPFDPEYFARGLYLRLALIATAYYRMRRWPRVEGDEWLMRKGL